MVTLSGHVRAWYWDASGVLRDCVVIEVDVVHAVERVVLDVGTLEEVDVSACDVLIEKPE